MNPFWSVLVCVSKAEQNGPTRTSARRCRTWTRPRRTWRDNVRRGPFWSVLVCVSRPEHARRDACLSCEEISPPNLVSHFLANCVYSCFPVGRRTSLDGDAVGATHAAGSGLEVSVQRDGRRAQGWAFRGPRHRMAWKLEASSLQARRKSHEFL